MGLITMELGYMEKLLEKESSLTPKVKGMKVNGTMIKLTDMASTFILMKQNMKDNGLMIYNMERAQRLGQITLFL